MLHSTQIREHLSFVPFEHSVNSVEINVWLKSVFSASKMIWNQLLCCFWARNYFHTILSKVQIMDKVENPD